MCCRYDIDRSPRMGEIVEAMNKSPLVAQWRDEVRIVTQGEVRPADVAPVIASNRSGVKTVFPMKWGFTGRSLLINARAETASAKATFRDAWASHRCVVPASAYFEWAHPADGRGRKRTGDKYAIRPRDGEMTWLCGLYRIESGLPRFVVLTRAPGEGIRFIHNRMPLILPEDCVDKWIKPGEDPGALLDAALTDMAYEKVEDHTADVQLSMF